MPAIPFQFYFPSCHMDCCGWTPPRPSVRFALLERTSYTGQGCHRAFPKPRSDVISLLKNDCSVPALLTKRRKAKAFQPFTIRALLLFLELSVQRFPLRHPDAVPASPQARSRYLHCSPRPGFPHPLWNSWRVTLFNRLWGLTSWVRHQILTKNLLCVRLCTGSTLLNAHNLFLLSMPQ